MPGNQSPEGTVVTQHTMSENTRTAIELVDTYAATQLLSAARRRHRASVRG